MLLLQPEVFETAAQRILRDAEGLSQVVYERRFRTLFGVTPKVCAIVWARLRENIPRRSSPSHLLWALLFLKCYAAETVNSTLTGVDEKTFRKWCWVFITLIANMNVIQWSARLHAAPFDGCYTSVDGTDFPIYEPTPFNPKWFSHKFKGPGLRYEVALCIETGHIVWAHGQFPCGSYPDLKVFRLGMKRALGGQEKVIADGTYKDRKCIIPSMLEGQKKRFYAKVTARHETVNRRFKQFYVLGHRFRHAKTKHSACFHAVCNLTQLMIENEDPLFSLS